MKEFLEDAPYPVFSLEVPKAEAAFASFEEILVFLRRRIDGHPVAHFIAEFDHLAHTRGLAEGQADEAILAAHNLVFCFGLSLPEPSALALRPRSLGVAETADAYHISFMEAPMPLANLEMERWARALCGEPTTDHRKTVPSHRENEALS